MRRRSVLGGLALATANMGGQTQAATKRQGASRAATPVLQTLAMPVTPTENRQYSYTDKVSGYFHGRTHMDNNPDWFNGWNIATKRIFHDYRLSVDGVALSRATAQVVVSPHRITRSFGRATETLSMLDGLAVLVVQIANVTGSRIGIALTGGLTDAGTLEADGMWFTPKEAVGSFLLLAPITLQALSLVDGVAGVTALKEAGGFFLIHAATKTVAQQLLARVRRNLGALLATRAARMEALVSGNHALDAGSLDRTKALLWMRLTGDQLVMRQLGTGIYAGLPWFNDYWGRDTFISITGLLLVNGQYSEAAEVFTSFAALQDVDPTSKTYGRVPNRARPDGIEYNSADGTPRFIIMLADLVQRSGDVALAKRLWPVVKRAVDGVLANNRDADGLITHQDADTWMDAKEKGTRAWSPRGNRAVDVQALWLKAFDGAVSLDVILNQQDITQPIPPASLEWQASMFAVRNRLMTAMSKFARPVTGHLVDHLRADGSQDLSVRPNALFAIGYGGLATPLTIKQLEREMTQVRDLWQSLVYPWGVATLSQEDPNFHPYHEHWHYYHKDASYHNGTVWPWLNGIAIEKMVEFNQIDLAWKLFENMNRQAFREGALGSLAECADALPLPGANWSRRTGTFLQAWSNAEHLRVWQECFLGFRPSGDGIVWVNSRLPAAIHDVVCNVRVGSGYLKSHFHIGGQARWRFNWQGNTALGLNFSVGWGDNSVQGASLRPGWSVDFEVKNGTLRSAVSDAQGRPASDLVPVMPVDAYTAQAIPEAERPATPEQRYALEQRIFAGLDFCKPRLQPNLKSLSVYHDPPLTY